MLNHFFDYKPEVLALDEKALELCQPYFKQMEDIRDYNQLKMLKADSGHRKRAGFKRSFHSEGNRRLYA